MRRPRPRRVAEGIDGGETDLPHQLEGPLEVLFRLARETDDEVGRQRQVRPRPAQPPDQVAVVAAGVPAAHAAEDAVGARLHRQVEVGADVGVPAHLRDHARETDLLTITKANSVSTVHRASYLDYIGIKTFDKSGRVTGERRFLGLFTSAVYSRSPREIPLLRHKIERLIEHFGLDPASHDGKAVMHVLETYPRDELFQASVADLIRIVRGIVNLYERHRVRVFMRRDAFDRFYSGMIFVPRDRYSTQVRNKIEALVRDRLRATHIESQVQLSESALARVHMIVRLPPDGGPRIDVDALEEQIAAAVRTWDDQLREALAARLGEIDGYALADRIENAFPAAYEEEVAAETAVDDVAQIQEVLRDTDRIAMRLVPAEGNIVHLRLARSAAPIALSSALPILENLGFTVLSERPYRITPSRDREVWLQDFEMQTRDGRKVDLAALGTRFNDAFPHMSGKFMVCGHTAQRSGLPNVLPHAVCLDTWAYGEGWLIEVRLAEPDAVDSLLSASEYEQQVG